MDKMKKDTTIYLKDIRDSIKNLSDAEKKLVDKGSLKVIMNMPDEIFSMAFSFPYSQPADLIRVGSVLNNELRKRSPEQPDGSSADEGERPGEGPDCPSHSASFFGFVGILRELSHRARVEAESAYRRTHGDERREQAQKADCRRAPQSGRSPCCGEDR